MAQDLHQDNKYDLNQLANLEIPFLRILLFYFFQSF